VKGVTIKVGFVVLDDTDPNDVVERIEDVLANAGVAFEFIDFEEVEL